MKKIYYMKFRYFDFCFILCLAVVYIVVGLSIRLDGIMILLTKFGVLEIIIRSISVIIPMVLMTGAYWELYQREMFYCCIDEKGYQSARFGKKYCYVDKRKDIYYSIFDNPFYKKEYIAFSNDPFESFWRTYGRKFNRYYLSFDGVYDFRRIIVLPYDKNTILEFDVENWKPVEVIKYGKRNRKTKQVEDAGIPKQIQKELEQYKKEQEIIRKIKAFFQRKSKN